VSRSEEKGERPAARIVYVTGKGGVGKTTLARALANSGSDGKKTVLVSLEEAEQHESGTGPLDTARLRTITLDPRRALAHLLERILYLRGLSDRVLSSRTFNSVAAAAPGLSDVVMLGYLADLSTGDTEFGCVDLIVVDGFSTGHARAMLEAPLHAAEMLGTGPGRDLIDRCRRLTTDENRFRAVVLASPEELPVTEAVELWSALREAGVPTLPPAINAVYPTLLDETQAEFARSGRAGSQAHWYEAACAAQSKWIAELRRSVETAPLCFEQDFGDGEIIPDAAAELLERWA
jgi:anion-transporting  ArsA/GET3 family ATPase